MQNCVAYRRQVTQRKVNTSDALLRYGVSEDGDPERKYLDKLFDLSVNFTYEEVDAGVERVLQHVQDHGPFDVVLGFSQGCIYYYYCY